MNRTLVKNGRKNLNIHIIFISLFFLIVTLSPNISLAFTSATATFRGTPNFGDIENIDVVRFEQNVNDAQTVLEHGTSTSWAEVGQVIIETLASEAVPKLLSSAAAGELIPEVEIDIDANKVIRLLTVKINDFSWSEIQGTPDVFRCSLSFSKIYWTYNGVTVGYDAAKGRVINP